ncbi:MAG: ATP synthase F1 subunit delta [Patescibacteria group bacterium]
MKISAKQYAVSLYGSVQGKTEKPELKKVLKNFVALLGKNNNLNKEEEILEIFENIWNTENGELKAELTSARELSKSSRETVINYLKEKSGAKKIVLDEKTNKEILGGFILKYNNRIIDGSLRSSLGELGAELEG